MANTVVAEQLKAGVILGDVDNDEYIYLPGGEVGVEEPLCIYEHRGVKEDLPLAQAAALALYLTLKPTKHPLYGKRAY